MIPLASRSFTLMGDRGILFMFIGIGLIAFLTGEVFPLLSHYAIRSSRAVGFSMSWVYFFNIVGSTAGSLITGFLFLNWFPIEKTIFMISLFTFGIGAFLWFLSMDSAPYRLWRMALVSGLGILVFSCQGPLYGHLLERLYHKQLFDSKSSFKFTVQNRQGIINVIAEPEGDDVVIGGGIYDGRFNTDLIRNRNGIDRAYMMAALHPKPANVLEIGLSSASWARVILNNPEVQKLDVVEINPGYLSIVKHYPESQSVLEDPKVTLFIDDGRRWLKRNPTKIYDFIIMNTTFFWRDQTNNLVSMEFFELCRRHLKPGGVLYLNTTSSVDIPYTAVHVFQYIIRYGSFIAASDSPFSNDPETKKLRLMKYIYHGWPINKMGDPGLLRILDGMATSPTNNLRESILSSIEIANIITDDNLASEFKTRETVYDPRRQWINLLRP